MKTREKAAKGLPGRNPDIVWWLQGFSLGGFRGQSGCPGGQSEAEEDTAKGLFEGNPGRFRPSLGIEALKFPLGGS